MKQFARGFITLRQHQKGASSIYLFRVNGTKYLVSVHYGIFRLMLRKRNFEFTEEQDAQSFYEKALTKMFI